MVVRKGKEKGDEKELGNWRAMTPSPSLRQQ